MSDPFDYKYYIVKPDPDKKILDQIADCIHGIRQIREDQLTRQVIVRISWFYALSASLSCSLIREYISISGSGGLFTVSPAFIAQAPVDGSHMEVMVSVIRNLGQDAVQVKSIAGIQYVLIKGHAADWLYAGGSECTSPALSCKRQSINTFTLVGDLLASENLSFNNLLRQWNYIGDILEQEITDKGLIQNYQEFNEVRRAWYHKNQLVCDFPAATGIGTKGGGVRIDFIACRPRDQFQVISLQNPAQQDAHQYSPEQLVGEGKQSPPMFERGKIVFNHGHGYIWVSGTAAIRGEVSIAGSTPEQTRITCENIERLIAADHLQRSGLPGNDYTLTPVYIRGYVKHRYDGLFVQEYLQEKFPGAVVHVLQADICRKELLVEIEAEFSLSKKISSQGGS